MCSTCCSVKAWLIRCSTSYSETQKAEQSWFSMLTAVTWGRCWNGEGGGGMLPRSVLHCPVLFIEEGDGVYFHLVMFAFKAKSWEFRLRQRQFRKEENRLMSAHTESICTCPSNSREYSPHFLLLLSFSSPSVVLLMITAKQCNSLFSGLFCTNLKWNWSELNRLKMLKWWTDTCGWSRTFYHPEHTAYRSVLNTLCLCVQLVHKLMTDYVISMM